MNPPLVWDDQRQLVRLLDQTRLPLEEHWLEIQSPEAMAEAIVTLRIRGAPAIGIAAAYGVALAAASGATPEEQRERARDAIALLGATRPTAVNLFWALERMRAETEAPEGGLPQRLLAEANSIRDEDLDAGRRLGEHGLSVLKDGMTVLTHCHTGGVATSGYGTALAPLLLSVERGLHFRAFVDETRPLLQGSRITAWELARAGVPATVITDASAAHVMRLGGVGAVLVGADRIAANGDVANKIGTYGLAILARAHDIPFYVSAPLSTVDVTAARGADIEIEERDPREVTEAFGRRTAPNGIDVYNPAFDITPAELVTAIITEEGVIRPPFEEQLRGLVERTTHAQTQE